MNTIKNNTMTVDDYRRLRRQAVNGVIGKDDYRLLATHHPVEDRIESCPFRDTVNVTTLRRRDGFTDRFLRRLPDAMRRPNPRWPDKPMRVWFQDEIDRQALDDPELADRILAAHYKRDTETDEAIGRIVILQEDPAMPADYKTWLPDDLRRLRWRLDLMRRTMIVDDRLWDDDCRYTMRQHDRYRQAVSDLFDHTYPQLALR